MFDLILQFFLAVPNSKGRLLKQRMEIVNNYLYGWFVPDLLFVLPYDILSYAVKSAGGSSLDMLRVLRVLKMFRLLRGQRIFTRMEDRYAINYALVQLFGYLLVLFGLCHWLACGWFLVIVLEKNQECVWAFVHDEDNQGVWTCCTNWFDCYPFRDFAEGNTLARQYFLALTWSTGEVLTVGSSVSATTDTERTYMLLARIISGVVYAYLLGAVCSIFTTASKDQNEYFQRMDTLNRFLQDHMLTETNADLCRNLRRFYRFSFHSASSNNSFDSIVKCISPLLRGQLAYEVHSTWLKKLPFFYGSELDNSFYVALALEMKSQLFAPLEIIIDIHHVADQVFIVDKGVVLAQGAPKTLGDSFGHDAISAFRHGQRRGYQAISFTHGSTFCLHCEWLLDLMQRPQFKKSCAMVLLRLSHMRAREVMLFFIRTIKEVVAQNKNYDSACSRLREELPFVKEAAMPKIIDIFKWSHHAKYGSVKAINSKMHARSMKSLKDERNVINIEQVTSILAEYSLETLAPKLVVDEKCHLRHLLQMNPEQLHQVGFPMGDALDFVAKWGGHTLEECNEKLAVRRDVSEDVDSDDVSHARAGQSGADADSSAFAVSPGSFSSHPIGDVGIGYADDEAE
mmetsp:Transcript_23568/g.44917  ORF Transcript_23568/g.44917 Transcript_23568/m.44917 type:complete len:626 (-) Transcript_23568:481-2358(-)